MPPPHAHIEPATVQMANGLWCSESRKRDKMPASHKSIGKRCQVAGGFLVGARERFIWWVVFWGISSVQLLTVTALVRCWVQRVWCCGAPNAIGSRGSLAGAGGVQGGTSGTLVRNGGGSGCGTARRVLLAGFDWLGMGVPLSLVTVVSALGLRRAGEERLGLRWTEEEEQEEEEEEEEVFCGPSVGIGGLKKKK